MKLNHEKWNARRREVETEIRKIKEVLQTPGHQGTWKEWSEFGKLAHEATNLYMLRAELRGEGRLHAKTEVRYVSDPRGGEYQGHTVRQVVEVTRDDQRKRAFAGWHHDYLRPEPAPVAVSEPA